ALPICLATDHLSPDRIRTTESPGREIDVASGECLANPRRRDRSTLEEDHGHDIDIESDLGADRAQGIDIPAASLSKTVIIADDEVPKPQTVDQDLLHESSGRIVREFPGEREEHHIVEAAPGQQLPLLLVRREEEGCGFGPDDRQWMGLEADQDALRPERFGRAPEFGDHGQMAFMDAIECPYGDRRTG